MLYKELEVKYAAEGVKFEDFVAFCHRFSIKKKLMVSSYDDYFVDPVDNFIRYRHRDGFGELTIKRKTSDKNNNNRVEVNVPTVGDNLNTVTTFVSLLGYAHNFGVFKTSQIFWVDKVVLAYYVVYDKGLRELRRFIEIEADEDAQWTSEEEAWNEVAKYEKLMESLGITPKNRLKKSLFELFKKDVLK
jgi:adenylate cyclase class IV